MTAPQPCTPARALRLAAAAAAFALLTLAAGCASLPAPEGPAESAPALPAGLVVLTEPTPESAPATEAAATPPVEPLTLASELPRTRLDPLQDAKRADLWPRVRDGFAMADLDGDLVRKWEQWYARDPAYVQRMTERGGRYLFHIVEEVQRRNMPAEIALLPFIESAFNPQAQSHAKASGMWQFMPATGKDFELRQNVFRDDRRDVLASTRAALDYLQRLYTQFGDWHLALAAYNWGQGNVQRAIDRNRRAGLPTDYPSLRMPQETREYVPKLQAVKNIVRHPEAFALTLPALGDHPFFLSVSIDRDIDVALAARLAGLPLDEFKQLNPQMNKPVILAAGTPQVLLPYDNANRFLRALNEHQGALASWTAWVAPRTVKPSEAARLTGMNETELREINLIPPRMLVKLGSTLLVPRAANGSKDVSEHIAENAVMNLAPEGRALRKVGFKAGRQGDSVAAVARRYRVSAAQVALWNGVSAQARFKAGQAVVVMLPAGKGSAKAAPAMRHATKAAPATRHAAKASAARKRAAVRVHLAQGSADSQIAPR
ncbi:MAG: transglycosylase SLT domain-containing protein [Rubrivivax sp.]|nr:transglycosylase SLT domain-containing protein [Rubrivivax sp.]